MPINNFPSFPLARRVAAQTIGSQLVSVQPMSMPTATLRYISPVEDIDYLLYRRKMLTSRMNAFYNDKIRSINAYSYVVEDVEVLMNILIKNLNDLNETIKATKKVI